MDELIDGAWERETNERKGLWLVCVYTHKAGFCRWLLCNQEYEAMLPASILLV